MAILEVNMDKDDVKRIVYNHLKDDYYIKLRALENDIDFFLMYMERNKKSDFRFDLRISHNGSFKAFNDIWKKYGYHKSEVETAFSEYILLKFTTNFLRINIYTILFCFFFCLKQIILSTISDIH